MPGERLRTRSVMGGCLSLPAREAVREVGGEGGEKSQPFELPQEQPLWPQETAPQMSLPRAREGGRGGFLTPVTFTLVI